MTNTEAATTPAIKGCFEPPNAVTSTTESTLVLAFELYFTLPFLAPKFALRFPMLSLLSGLDRSFSFLCPLPPLFFSVPPFLLFLLFLLFLDLLIMGLAVGEIVWPNIGLVGLTVGEIVGLTVGLIVGDVVGLIVGLTVGEMV